ncbi:hypothetical protein HED49_07090 [Ochrobactrum daejeonense]|nr:hypothetical protein [Brucella daejeonensis]
MQGGRIRNLYQDGAGKRFYRQKADDIIKRLAEKGYYNIPKRLRPFYDDHLNIVKSELQPPFGASAKASIAAGKLMAFLLVDRPSRTRAFFRRLSRTVQSVRSAYKLIYRRTFSPGISPCAAD